MGHKQTQAESKPVAHAVNPTPATQPVLNQLIEYRSNYNNARIRPEWAEIARMQANRLRSSLGIYTIVADKLSGIPPYVIGLIHMMEASFQFDRHLHNGDPLSARTVNVPAGRPEGGKPPFQWSESAIDALSSERVRSVTSWDIPNVLRFLEGYNGWGYRSLHAQSLLPGVLSPYLWSGTTLYTKGKYVADGVFSPDKVSKQLGCVACMLALGDYVHAN